MRSQYISSKNHFFTFDVIPVVPLLGAEQGLSLYKSWQNNVEADAMKMHREFEKNSVKAGLQGFVFGKKLLFDVDTFWMLNWNISARTLCCGSTLSTTISLNFKDANKKCKTLCKRCILELMLKLTDVCLSSISKSKVKFHCRF